jgi:aspartyl-tRNA(Asn)/glutamyl-tRNA(Gln) amidotransferase subunit A
VADALAVGRRLAAGAPRSALEAADLGDSLTAWPTVAHVAPELAPLEADDDRFLRVNFATLRATLPASFLDLPGLALPAGTDPAGLPPVSLLLSGPPRADARVLAAGAWVEAALR